MEWSRPLARVQQPFIFFTEELANRKHKYRSMYVDVNDGGWAGLKFHYSTSSVSIVLEDTASVAGSAQGNYLHIGKCSSFNQWNFGNFPPNSSSSMPKSFTILLKESSDIGGGTGI